MINLVPCLVIYQYTEMPFFLLLLLFYFSLLVFNKILPNFSYKNNNFSNKMVRNVLFIISVVLPLYIWFTYAGFRVFFDFTDIYSIRAEARQYAMPTIIYYLFLAVQILLQTFIVYYLELKQNKKCILAAFCLIIVFFINGSRASLLSAVLIFTLYYLHKYINDFHFIVTSGLSIVNISAVLELYFNNTYFIGRVLVDRLLFMPNSLNFLYYKFFTQNPLDYFQSGFLSHFGLKSDYFASIPRVIGWHYFGNFYGDEVTNANNGLFSDAYANLGILGMIIMPFVIILALRLFDLCTYKINYTIIICVATMIALKLNSDSIFTLLLSGGFGFLYILLASFSRESSC